MMLFRKMIRTIGKYKAQFISMIIMIALGIGIFLGFNMEWISLEKNTAKFLDDTNFADYRIVSTQGFTKDDLEAISDISGVDYTSRYISVNADVDGSDNMVGLTVTENFDVSGFIVTDGEEYDPESTDGIWLFDHYADENNVKLGDTMKLTYENFSFEGKVKGFIESGEYMICVRDESQLMPDFKTYGYAYISPVMLKNTLIKTYTDKLAAQMGESIANDAYSAIYPQLNVLSSLDKSEFNEAVNDKIGKTLLVLSKDETVSYSESQGEIEEGKTMGSILPVLFLLIAILTMVTTMHRIAAAEKTQIGTLKALGFKDRRILRHYTSFALLIGVVGTALGILLGYGVGRYIMNPDGMMGTYIVMPEWKLYMPWWCYLVLFIIIAFLTLIGYLSTKQMLKGTAADALRPYTPKKMRRLAIERAKLWDKLSFGAKWNLRDILRHKSRSFMTLFGIIGCMILMVGALGMFDTANLFLDIYYDDVTAYTSRIFVSDTADNTKAQKLAETYNGDTCASMSVQIDDKAVSLDVYNIKHDTIRFLNEKNDIIDLPNDGALICIRIADEFSLKEGDKITISPYGTSEEYTLKVAGINRSVTESISISEEYAKTLYSSDKALTDSKAYKINSVFTNTKKADISSDSVSSIQSKQDIVDSFDSFMDMLYLSVFVLIAAAVVLGIVVLYNLGIMSYTERYREMATLKVVGFKDKQIGKLLISQNLWLSVIGVVIGLFAGIGVLSWLLKALASEYEMKLMLGALTYLVSIILTFGVSFAVGLIISGKNKKIDMVSALKTEE